MQWAARSSGRVRLNDPRKDFASGVRELATMTASLMESGLRRSCLLLIHLRERAALLCQALQQRRGCPQLAVTGFELADPIVHSLQTDSVGVPHRTAAIDRETIAG